jgi:nucleotide-binding universal stress UspA family protein
MTYTSILVQAEPGPDAQARLKCAVDLADRFGALVVGIGAQKVPGVGPVEPLSALQAEWLVAMRDQVEAELRSAEQSFREAVGSRRCLWKTRRIRPAEALAQAARCADLIVAGGAARRDHGMSVPADIPKLLLSAGRPVLLAPPEGSYMKGESILVAWKDSREARRAVIDALPFLKRAKDVLVIEVAQKVHIARAQEAVAEVASALGLHGVTARSEAVEGDGDEALDLIAERTRWLGADLIVSGAYGHSRVGEMMLGGLTQGLLEQQEFFVLFSH